MTQPIRILQVVGKMDPGGTETWLMHVLRHIDRERFRMDFLVHTTDKGAYDDEIRTLGGGIVYCLEPSKPRTYGRNLRRILRESGPYTIVHSHIHHYSGYVLRLASQAGVKVRIAHSHTSAPRTKAGILRRLYLAVTEKWVAQYATVGLAASRDAAATLFGPGWEANPRRRVLYCGIDLAAFQTGADRVVIRSGLGLPWDAFLLGHVGRFVEVKNHRFLVEVAAEVARREPGTYLLLAGDGPLRQDVEHMVCTSGLGDRTIFVGLRPDVPDLMGAMDLFVFPSFFEGLPLALLEAQAAALPCVVSDVIPREADVVPELIWRLSLDQPASIWADTILAARHAAPVFSRGEALAIVEGSCFNIQASVRELERVYARESAG